MAIHIELNPALWEREPWASLPPSARAQFFYVIEDAASVHTQALLWPRPTAGGLVNGLPKVSGQGPSRMLAIGVHGERIDENVLWAGIQQNMSGGTLLQHICDGIDNGVLLVHKEDGTNLTTDDLYQHNF